MNHRIVSLSIIVGIASIGVACRSSAESPQPVEPTATKEVALVAAVPAMPMLPLQTSPAAPKAQADGTAAAPVDARAERLTAITNEYSEAMNAYYAAIQTAMGDNKNPSQEDWQKVQEKVHEPDSKAFIDRVQKLVDEDATDVAALHAIEWLLDNSRAPDVAPALLALVEKHHMNRPEMGEMCSRLAQHDRRLLEQLLAHSPHKDVRGQACMALTEALKDDIQTAEYLKTAEPKDREGYVGYLGADKVAALGKLDVKQTQVELEALYERVVSEFGEVKINAGTKRETTLGKQASAALFEIRNLAVGKTTPEIEGSDLDKVAFKLSDYRGKIVLLDFWGNW